MVISTCGADLLGFTETNFQKRTGNGSLVQNLKLKTLAKRYNFSPKQSIALLRKPMQKNGWGERSLKCCYKCDLIVILRDA